MFFCSLYCTIWSKHRSKTTSVNINCLNKPSMAALCGWHEEEMWFQHFWQTQREQVQTSVASLVSAVGAAVGAGVGAAEGAGVGAGVGRTTAAKVRKQGCITQWRTITQQQLVQVTSSTQYSPVFISIIIFIILFDLKWMINYYWSR